MTIFEILNFNRELLVRLRQAGVRLEDADYVDLFMDYNEMVGGGLKVTYAVAVLADRYGVSERKVYSLLKRYKSDCNALKMGGGISSAVSSAKADRGVLTGPCSLVAA